MWQLDHLAVVCTDLAEGVAQVEQALGVAMQPGGQHARFGTHNALLGLEGGLYLEVIAPQPGSAAEGPRWFDLDRFSGPPRLGNWICRVPDLAAALAASPPEAGRSIDMERGDLRWKIAVPDDGGLPMQGGWPTLIEWAAGTRHPADRLARSGCALSALVVRHPMAGQLEASLSGLLRDDRLRFEPAARPGLRAEFLTPGGARSLQ